MANGESTPAEAVSREGAETPQAPGRGGSATGAPAEKGVLSPFSVMAP